MSEVRHCAADDCREPDEPPGSLLRCSHCRQWFCDDHADTTAGVAIMVDRRTGQAFLQSICYECKRSITP
jgi:hypothetical protein